ncbi:hypothetical protein GCM10022419_121670 [Nonomuraea rosea]|uniref:Uncharacterized protein n=1 Tax=Nonomuraea rosea TaxID=638574 RepID=A0ABP6ZP83_9ACTN
MPEYRAKETAGLMRIAVDKHGWIERPWNEAVNPAGHGTGITRRGKSKGTA